MDASSAAAAGHDGLGDAAAKAGSGSAAPSVRGSSSGPDKEAVSSPPSSKSGPTVGEDDLLTKIKALKEEQSTLRNQKKAVAKDLRNIERRRKRLKKKAKQLSDADLVAVMRMRQAMSTTRSTRSGIPKEVDADDAAEDVGEDVAEDVGEDS